MKTIKQISRQSYNMILHITKTSLSDTEKERRARMVTETARRYRRNAMAHIKSTGIDVDNFAYLPVSREIYAGR